MPNLISLRLSFRFALLFVVICLLIASVSPAAIKNSMTPSWKPLRDCSMKSAVDMPSRVAAGRQLAKDRVALG